MSLHRPHRSERGAGLVEAALVTPLVLLVVFGVFEFSLVFRQYLTVVNSARNMARSVTVTGNAASSDYTALQEFVRSSKALARADLEYIVVFKAPNVDASPETTSSLAGCMSASIVGVCNRYTAADLTKASNLFTGQNGAPDAAWPPNQREVRLSGPPDYVGVFVKARRSASSGVFGTSHDFAETVVYRIEPQTR